MAADRKCRFLEFGLCLIFVSTVIGDETPECTSVWKNFGNCVIESIKVDNCELNPLSNATQCFKKFSDSSQSCEEVLIHKLLKHTIDVHSLMDKLICETNLKTEIDHSKSCNWIQLSQVVFQFANVYQLYYNEVGCKKLITDGRRICGEENSFLDKLINASSCNRVNVPKVEISDEDITTCSLGHHVDCLYNFGDKLPVCGTRNKPLQECLKTADSYDCPLYSTENMKKGIQERYLKSVEYTCKNDEIRKVLSNRECWKRNFENNVITQALTQSMLTPEGCRVFWKMQNIHKVSNSACEDAVQILSDNLSADFPCPSGNCGYSVQATLIVLYVFLFLTVLH